MLPAGTRRDSLPDRMEQNFVKHQTSDEIDHFRAGTLQFRVLQTLKALEHHRWGIWMPHLPRSGNQSTRRRPV